MSANRPLVSHPRRRLLQAGTLAFLLGRQQIAFGASVVAVRVWPAPEYTRVTIESDTKLSAKQFFVTTPPRLAVDIEGTRHQMCCTGCQAVAQSIVSSGLIDYYKRRDAMPEQAREAMPDELKDLGLFDHPDFQQGFVKPIGEHEREAALILEGITCSACIWLNEQHVAHQPGVTAVDINYATRRARVRWEVIPIPCNTA